MTNEIERLKAHIKTLEKVKQYAVEEGRVLGLVEAAEYMVGEAERSRLYSEEVQDPENKSFWGRVAALEKDHAEHIQSLASGESEDDDAEHEDTEHEDADDDNCACTVGADWCATCRSGHPR